MMRGTILKYKALTRVEEVNFHAFVHILSLVAAYARYYPKFTTDDLNKKITYGDGVEHRVMGAVMSKAAQWKLIRKSGMMVKSKRPICHGRDIPVWYSMVYGGR